MIGYASFFNLPEITVNIRYYETSGGDVQYRYFVGTYI